MGFQFDMARINPMRYQEVSYKWFKNPLSNQVQSCYPNWKEFDHIMLKWHIFQAIRFRCLICKFGGPFIASKWKYRRMIEREFS